MNCLRSVGTIHAIWLILMHASDSLFVHNSSEYAVPDPSISSLIESSDSAAPEPVLAPASDSESEDEDVSKSDVSESDSSAPDMLLPDNVPKPSDADYDMAESESGPEPVLDPKVHGRLEDLYIRYYGNDPWVERCWTPIRELNSDENEDRMKAVCIEYHKLARKGSLKPEQLFIDFNKRLLKFRTKKTYLSTNTDVLCYSVNDTKAADFDDMHHFYITRGMGSDCVFFLTPTDKTATEFYLEEHVCKNNAAAQQWINRANRMKGTKGAGGATKGNATTSSESTDTSVEEIDEQYDEVAAESRESKSSKSSSVEKVAKPKGKKAREGEETDVETREGKKSPKQAQKLQRNGTTTGLKAKSKMNKSKQHAGNDEKNIGGTKLHETGVANKTKASNVKSNKGEKTVKKNGGKAKTV